MEVLLNNPEFEAIEKLVILTDVLSGELANLERTLSSEQLREINALLQRAEEIISGTVIVDGSEIVKLVERLEKFAEQLGAAY